MDTTIKQENINIIDILKLNNKEILNYIDILALDYLEKTGKKLNRTCPVCLRQMILTLKNFYNMTQFELKNPKRYYKLEKGSSIVINQSIMTDEKAIQFLKINPERIQLFSKYPSNWKKLIENGLDSENPEKKEVRFAIEAEMETLAESKKQNTLTEDELNEMSLKDLRELYPDINSRSKEDFINKVLIH